jgi:hypothetical protein
MVYPKKNMVCDTTPNMDRIKMLTHFLGQTSI